MMKTSINAAIPQSIDSYSIIVSTSMDACESKLWYTSVYVKTKRIQSYLNQLLLNHKHCKANSSSASQKQSHKLDLIKIDQIAGDSKSKIEYCIKSLRQSKIDAKICNCNQLIKICVTNVFAELLHNICS